MNKFGRGLLAAVLIGAVSFAPVTGSAEQPFVTTVYAHGHHGGNGHHGQCGGVMEKCYYYCGGHEAHEHPNGICPYADSTVRKVQKKLKKLGYRCGKANGIMNTKTKKALKRFQRDHCLKVNGVIKKRTLRALGL